MSELTVMFPDELELAEVDVDIEVEVLGGGEEAEPEDVVGGEVVVVLVVDLVLTLRA